MHEFIDEVACLGEEALDTTRDLLGVEDAGIEALGVLFVRLSLQLKVALE